MWGEFGIVPLAWTSGEIELYRGEAPPWWNKQKSGRLSPPPPCQQRAYTVDL